VIEGLFAERQQVESHLCREVTRSLREVRTSEIRGRSDCGHKVRDERHVQHFLHSDPVHHRAPPVDGAGLLGSQAITSAVLEAELCEQVLTHDHVLELQRLREQNPEVLAVFDDDLGLGDVHVQYPTVKRCRTWVGRSSSSIIATA
jgi:hypothetical protein